MEEKIKRRFKKRTILGYFFLGVAAFLVGVVYGLYEDAYLYSSYHEILIELFDSFQSIFFAVASSFLFYYVFFKIRRNIDNIAVEYDNKGKIVYSLKEKELLELREKYIQIKKAKKTDEPVKEEDICASEESPEIKKALIRWMSSKNSIFGVAVLYCIATVVVLVVVLGMPDRGIQFWRFFAPYVTLFVISTCFYAVLFCTLRIKSFMRLSYSVLYPTILTIAVNIYFGLSVNKLCMGSLALSVYMPIALFAFFFIVTAIIELMSYMIKDKDKNEHFSTYGFVGMSFLILIISIIIFSLCTNFFKASLYTDSFSNLLFAIAISLYLGIFEGWDSLRNMNIDEKSPLFAKHYRWWNFLQICYPLAFFFLVGLVQSEIFTFGLMVTFTIVSIISTIVWKRGGEKKLYSETNWGIRKILFGATTVILIFANRLLVMNGILNLKTPPTNLDTDKINVELIVVLLGALNWLFVFWGVKEDEQKRFVLMALPLKEVKEYKDFSAFCRYGFIYDFSNYIYLIYILVVHVLLFSTGLLPRNSAGNEGAATILIILMIITYMFFSFKTKILINSDYGETIFEFQNQGFSKANYGKGQFASEEEIGENEKNGD